VWACVAGLFIEVPSVDTPVFRPERKRNACGAGQE
jgi:hypothetical protein